MWLEFNNGKSIYKALVIMHEGNKDMIFGEPDSSQQLKMNKSTQFT